jgi:two-component system, OmpR family, sensor histidine kinase KdpD
MNIVEVNLRFNTMFGRPLKFERYGYLVALVFVTAATALFILGREYFAKGQWALLYLLIIAFVASLSGVRPALAAAVLSFLAWNFFLLPPYNTFRIHDPKDWLSLVVFLAVGILIGIQTGRIREREKEARTREQETALLNRFSAYLVSNISELEMGNILISEVSHLTQAEEVALFLPNREDSLTELAASPGATGPQTPEVKALVEWAYRQSKAVGLPIFKEGMKINASGWPITVSPGETGISGPGNTIFLPLQTSTYQSGVLYLKLPASQSDLGFHEARLLVALANQAAVFLERRHLQTIAIQAEAAQEADRLKSTLVSAVSHELKTPLSSMTAIVTNLLEGDLEWQEARAWEEIQALQNDLKRLNSSIGSLLDLSRLEASEWKPQLEWYDFGEILGSVLAELSPKERARISFALPEDLPPIRVDFPQWMRALHNLLENALNYSGEAPVRVGASASPKEVRLWVEDEGPGIDSEERQQVFEKFYRGKTAVAVPSGTGLGLTISAEIVRFHNGRIWIEEVIPHGARFVIALPKGEPTEVTA